MRWKGHILRKVASSTTRQALTWKRKRGRPRNTWPRDLEADNKRTSCTWGKLERLAQDRDGWRDLTGGVCPDGVTGDDDDDDDDDDDGDDDDDDGDDNDDGDDDGGNGDDDRRRRQRR